MTESIGDIDTLEKHFGEPIELALAVMLDSLDKFHKQYIERSPFACIATSDASGQPTISPKGDAPGFIKIIDDNTLLMPDRIGNNKVESFHNLVENPKMGLIFMIPGLRETLRISGEAAITTDQKYLKACQVGKTPVRTGLLIKVSKVYFHCGKAMIRSRLWDEESKAKTGELASFGEILKEEARINESKENMENHLEEVYEKELY
ncbi:MAG: pyridoxamine 5'-phosphate oxidase family protein [Gammaproteobacteria bacterium]|nr:pyridoxamine 5'-phosphate oxidase family protein [Gammaproteobacteria bacterium]